MVLFKKGEEELNDLYQRIENRQKINIYKSILKLGRYFVQNGDTRPQARQKVESFINTVPSQLFLYSLGSEQPLKDAVQATTLPFMEQGAKDKFLESL